MAVHAPQAHADDQINRETVSIDEFAHMLGISRSTFYHLQRDPSKDLPKQIPLGLRHKRYRRDEAQAYAKYGKGWRVMLDLR